MWTLSSCKISLIVFHFLLLRHSHPVDADTSTQLVINTEVDYAFSYSVEQPELGLVTHHWEKRVGHLVTGGYSMLEPNGQVRVVEYRVDGNLGFNAIVNYRKPPGQFLGHLKFPHHYRTPIRLMEPVSLITPDLFKPKEFYPNLPSPTI